MLYVLYAEYSFLVTGPDGVSDSQLSASSYYFGLNPEYARLNSSSSWGTLNRDNPDDFIQVQYSHRTYWLVERSKNDQKYDQGIDNGIR